MDIEIEFTCEDCGDNRIEEIMTDVTVASQITVLHTEDGLGDCEYGDSSSHGGGVDRYQCVNCGCAIEFADKLKSVNTLEELVECLEERKAS
jgi:hypothetical protein